MELKFVGIITTVMDLSMKLDIELSDNIRSVN